MANSNGILALIFCSLLILSQNIVAGIKVWLISKCTTVSISKTDAIKSFFVGSFFSQLLFSLGGDAIRGWYLYRKASNLLVVSSIVLLDRITGFIALGCLYFGSLYGLTKIIEKSHLLSSLQLLGALCFTLIIGFLLCIVFASKFTFSFLAPLKHLLKISKEMLCAGNKTLLILVISFAINLSNVFVLYIAGNLYGVDLSFTNYMIVSVPAILLSLIPITVAGWGVRESAIMVGFGFMGISSTISLSISLTFGIASIIASLPGLLFTINNPLKLKEINLKPENFRLK